jgi:hypothetical protein
VQERQLLGPVTQVRQEAQSWQDFVAESVYIFKRCREFAINITFILLA